MKFHENRLPADESHEILCLICYFWKRGKIWNCRLLQIVGGFSWVKMCNGPFILYSLFAWWKFLWFFFFLPWDNFQHNFFFRNVRMSKGLDPDQADILSDLILLQTVYRWPLLWSVDDFVNSFLPRSGQAKFPFWSGSKLFDMMMVFREEFF